MDSTRSEKSPGRSWCPSPTRARRGSAGDALRAASRSATRPASTAPAPRSSSSRPRRSASALAATGIEERVEAKVGCPDEHDRPGDVYQRDLDRTGTRREHHVAGTAGGKQRAEHGARRIQVLGDHRRARARDARHHAVTAGGGPPVDDRHVSDDPGASVPVQHAHRRDGPTRPDEALVDRVRPDRGRQVPAVTPVVHVGLVDAHLREQVLDIGAGPLARATPPRPCSCWNASLRGRQAASGQGCPSAGAGGRPGQARPPAGRRPGRTRPCWSRRASGRPAAAAPCSRGLPAAARRSACRSSAS